MTTGDHRAHLQRDHDWRRWVFLLLAVVPPLLVIPLIVENILLIAALAVGGLIGIIFTILHDYRSRRDAPEKEDREHSREPVAVGQSVASVTPASTYVPYRAPTYIPQKAPTYVPQKPSALLPSAHGDGHRANDPPVLEGGTRAGRSPWRLPIGQAQSGIAADAAQLGDLEVRAASVIGPGHRCCEPATARQDAYALMQAHSGSHLIVAVADGLSSSASSEIGARVAVSAAARFLHRELEVSPDLEHLSAGPLFREVAGEMVGTGRNRAIDDRALCSLLIVAVIPAIAQRDGSRRVWTAQVGDVSLWLHGRDGWSQRTGKSKAGLDRNMVDAVLPFNYEQVVAGFVNVQHGQGIAVMTDGLGDTLSAVATAKPLFSERWARPPHLARFVSDLCFDAPGQNDDRTAVVVWCGQRT